MKIFRELFFIDGVELIYDAATGDYGLRKIYRSRFSMDKFKFREYGTVMPVKRMFIKHSDFLKIAAEIDRFLSIHKRIGKGHCK